MCIHIHPIIPRPLLPTILIFISSSHHHPIIVLPFTANKTNTIWSETEWILSCWTTPTGLLCFFCLSIIAARLSLCSSSSMIKRGMSSISHADESCFLTLIRTLRGLAMGAEEHLHQTLIQQIGCFIYLFQSESTRMKMDMGTVVQSLHTII